MNLADYWILGQITGALENIFHCYCPFKVCGSQRLDVCGAQLGGYDA